MSPAGERHRRKLKYRRDQQTNTRAGPSPGGQPFGQQQTGFGGPGMAQPGMAQPYQQMPGSAGGYGRGQPQQQWGQPTQGNFNQNGFGGYQG
jgi:nucleolysin TIA-1/TIAR